MLQWRQKSKCYSDGKIVNAIVTESKCYSDGKKLFLKKIWEERVENLYDEAHKVKLTHFQPIFHFYTPLKTPENPRFFYVFRGYKSGSLVENGLRMEFKLIPNCLMTCSEVSMERKFCFRISYSWGISGTKKEQGIS